MGRIRAALWCLKVAVTLPFVAFPGWVILYGHPRNALIFAGITFAVPAFFGLVALLGG